MGNPQQAPEVKAPEIMGAEKTLETDHEIAETNKDLTERAEQLVDKMANLYVRQLNVVITMDQLRAIPDRKDVPDWKKVAARKALTMIETPKTE